MKLKQWHNGMGFDYRNWELYRFKDGVWIARLFLNRNDPQPYKAGIGSTYLEAMLKAKPID